MVLAFVTVRPSDDISHHNQTPQFASKKAMQHCGQRCRPQQASQETRARHIPIDVLEKQTSYEIKADVPGVPKEHVKVDLEDQVLIIGTQPIQKEEEQLKEAQQNATRRLQPRVLRLPEDVDMSKIHASCENGVLTISLPKKEQKQAEGPRRIAVA